ncbi:MAG: ribonuclease domain-containing protein [Brotaphodocola sp.]
MKYRIRRVLLWLLATFMVVVGVAGCGLDMTAEEKAEALRTAGKVVEAVLETAEETKVEIDAESEQVQNQDRQESLEQEQAQTELDEHGSYTSCNDVAAYLHTYGHLPENYITKQEAEELGWNSKEGNLWDVAPGKSIGGSRFGNYEKLLPEKQGRKYFECDIDYEGDYRGAKRIIYSNDGLIFYTEDHYKTFEQLY